MSKIRMSSQVGRVMAGLITEENKHAPATPLPAPDHGAFHQPAHPAPPPSRDVRCDGCDSRPIVAVRAVLSGRAACCPDCSTLSVDERNELRALAPHGENEPQYATIGELYDLIGNELDETRTREDAARLTAAMHALDERNPPPVEPATAAPAARVTSEMVDRALSKACYHLALLRPDEPESNDERLREHLKYRLIAKHLTAALSAGGK